MKRPPLILILFSAFLVIAAVLFSCGKKNIADPALLIGDADFSDAEITLPSFKFDSADAEKANTELEGYAQSWREWSVDNISISSAYSYEMNSDLLSVLVTESFYDGTSTSASYYSYLFNTDTGKRLGYSSFLVKFGISAEQAEFYIKEAVTALAVGWTDDSFMPYKTLRGAYTQTIKNYTDSVASDYLTYYFGADEVPYVTVTVVTPSGSEETKIALTESGASQLLRGKWTLDTGDTVYTLDFSAEGSLTLTAADSLSGEVKTSSGSYSTSSDGTSIVLNYDLGGGFVGSMRVSGTLVNEFIAQPIEGKQLRPGEYTYVETAEIYDDGMLG
jgi:hypothetical protein